MREDQAEAQVKYRVRAYFLIVNRGQMVVVEFPEIKKSEFDSAELAMGVGANFHITGFKTTDGMIHFPIAIKVEPVSLVERIDS